MSENRQQTCSKLCELRLSQNSIQTQNDWEPLIACFLKTYIISVKHFHVSIFCIENFLHWKLICSLLVCHSQCKNIYNSYLIKYIAFVNPNVINTLIRAPTLEIAVMFRIWKAIKWFVSMTAMRPCCIWCFASACKWLDYSFDSFFVMQSVSHARHEGIEATLVYPPYFFSKMSTKNCHRCLDMEDFAAAPPGMIIPFHRWRLSVSHN